MKNKTIYQCTNLSFAISEGIFLNYKVQTMDNTKFIIGDLLLLLFLTFVMGLNIYIFLNDKK